MGGCIGREGGRGSEVVVLVEVEGGSVEIAGRVSIIIKGCCELVLLKRTGQW